MRVSTRCRTFALVLLVLSALAVAPKARADEGFWLPNAFPHEALERRYGVQVSPAWLQQLQLASVRFAGGSGAFISPDGLVLTNHHVALGWLQRLSSAERDLVGKGFIARSRSEELEVPGLGLQVLVEIEDVTARVNRAVRAGASPADAYAARRAAIAGIEQEAQAGARHVRGEVVTLYKGALFHLYRYQRFDDVRLVFAPEFDVAFFGGDRDNFTYPRFALDAALFRVYEDGRPVQPRHYLPVAPGGAQEGDVVFVAGHPGATQRLNTVAHLGYLRTTGIPLTLDWLERRHRVLARYAARGPEPARQVKDDIFWVENSLKSYRGQLAGLEAPEIMDRKRREERALREAVDANPEWAAQFGGAWEAVARSRKALETFVAEEVLLEGPVGFASSLFHYARLLVRLAAEDEKPDEERLPEFTDARRPDLDRKLFSPSPIYPDAERVTLEDSLALLAETLGADHPAVRVALAGRSPGRRAAELIGGSRLADVEVREALADGGAEAIARSTDTMIRLARAIDPAARALRTRYEQEVLSVERDAYGRIARAGFAVSGGDVYPDGTSSLRFSFGTIAGYDEGEGLVAPFTDLGGLYRRAEERGPAAPYALPESWTTRQHRVQRQTPLNFVSSNDIVGGNSGSPVVNLRGELVGVVFDGNRHSLASYFVYDPARNRAVSVDVRAILTALRDVYDADVLAAEILREAQATAAR